MLTPEQLAYCADDIIKLYSQLEESIVRDIARRIVKTCKITDTAKWQIQHLQELGTLHTDILSSIAQHSGNTEAELQNLFEAAGITATEYDNEIYRQNGLEPKSIKVSASQKKILEAGYKKTQGNLKNLTLTTAVSSQTSFIDACNLAELKVTSGAFTPQQAILDAINQIAEHGAEVIYPSGHKDKLDVAVRRNVMTGIGQTTGEVCLANARELGCDLMEITAHAGARPSHALWQGKIVSLSGREGYLSLEDIGYGTGDGFKGWNCRHDWYPYFEGSPRTYTEEYIEKLNAKSVKYPDGTMHTVYEAQQKQRAMERKIRETKRILAAQDECIKNTDSKSLRKALQEDFEKYSVKLKNREEQLNDFCEKTGLVKDNQRLQKYGFGRSTAQKAVWANKKTIANSAENDILNDRGKNYIPVTNTIIKNITVPEINGLPNIKESHLQESLKSLLALAKEQKLGTEVSMALDYTFKEIPNSRSIGKIGSVKITEQVTDYYGLHNHPSNTGLSLPDVISFLKKKNMLGIIAIGNGGKCYGLIEIPNKSNRFSFANQIMNCGQQKLNCGVSYNQIFKNRNDDSFYKNFNLNSKDVESDVLTLTRKIIKEDAEKYGYKYFEFE